MGDLGHYGLLFVLGKAYLFVKVSSHLNQETTNRSSSQATPAICPASNHTMV